MVIAIDGPGGVGKSTVSSRVAAALGLPHLDTGSTYRAAGLMALRRGADVGDAAAVVEAVRDAHITIDLGVVSVDGVEVTQELRGDDVTAASSAVATHPEVRAGIVALQRAWVAEHGGSAVVEGRDIGTVVFPDAPVKVYLTARPEVRAARRATDAEAGSKSQKQIAADLAARDHADSTRATSPLRPADDAVIVDTSDLDIDEVVETILGVVESVESRRHRPR
ncbi:MAG: (d)CMP kinase [Acidimicrobiia bacterium]